MIRIAASGALALILLQSSASAQQTAFPQLRRSEPGILGGSLPGRLHRALLRPCSGIT